MPTCTHTYPPTPTHTHTTQLVHTHTCSGKTITKCCLSQLSGHFYIGTEGGNVFILDVKHFQLDSEIIYWNNTTAL